MTNLDTSTDRDTDTDMGTITNMDACADPDTDTDPIPDADACADTQTRAKSERTCLVVWCGVVCSGVQLPITNYARQRRNTAYCMYILRTILHLQRAIEKIRFYLIKSGRPVYQEQDLPAECGGVPYSEGATYYYFHQASTNPSRRSCSPCPAPPVPSRRTLRPPAGLPQ